VSNWVFVNAFAQSEFIQKMIWCALPGVGIAITGR
jgi:hypothetical protein